MRKSEVFFKTLRLILFKTQTTLPVVLIRILLLAGRCFRVPFPSSTKQNTIKDRKKLKIRKFPFALKGFETAKRRRGRSVDSPLPFKSGFYEYNCKTREEK